MVVADPGVVATYVAVVAGIGTLAAGDEVPQVLAAALVAAGFQPARAWVQRRVDHLVRGNDATPLALVRQVGSRLGTAGTDDLLAAVVRSVATSLRLGSAAVEGPDPAAGGAGAPDPGAPRA